MIIVAGVTEVDLHLTFDNDAISIWIIIKLGYHSSCRVRYFSDAAEMIACVKVITGIALTNSLFALVKKPLGGRAHAITFFANLVAAPDKCLCLNSSNGRS